MPPLRAADHLLRYLWLAGPTMPGPAGPVPLTHQELAAWQTSTRTPLQPWEAQWVRDLSWAYVAELHRAEKPNCPPPWPCDELQALNAATASMDLRASLAAMAADD